MYFIKCPPYISNSLEHVFDVTDGCSQTSQLLSVSEPDIYTQLVFAHFGHLKIHVFERLDKSSPLPLHRHHSALDRESNWMGQVLYTPKDTTTADTTLGPKVHVHSN